MSVTNATPLEVYRGEVREFTCVAAMTGGSAGRSFYWRIGTPGSAAVVTVTLTADSETTTSITLTGTLTAEQSGTLTAGTYDWRVHATNPVEVLADGTIEVSDSIGASGII